MPGNTNDSDTILQAIIEGRPYSFPQSSEEKAKIIEALTARVKVAILDHQTRVINRIIKAVSRETDIPEEDYLKQVQLDAAKEAEKVISLENVEEEEEKAESPNTYQDPDLPCLNNKDPDDNDEEPSNEDDCGY